MATGTKRHVPPRASSRLLVDESPSACLVLDGLRVLVLVHLHDACASGVWPLGCSAERLGKDVTFKILASRLRARAHVESAVV